MSQPVELADVSDPRVEVYARLTDAALRRRQDTVHGIYLAESSQVVRRALAAGHTPRSFFLAHRYLESMADGFAERTCALSPEISRHPSLFTRTYT